MRFAIFLGQGRFRFFLRRGSVLGIRVFNARVITGFQRTAPNRVEITVHADAIHLGSLFGADAAPPSPRMNRPLDTAAIPAAPIAVLVAVRAKMGSIPVPSFTLSVFMAMVARDVRESRPPPSGTHTASKPFFSDWTASS